MAYGYVPPTGYRDPNDKYSANPQGNYAQESDFFKGQKYVNPYADFTKSAMANSAAYNARQPRNPFGAGGPLGSKDAFGQAFGYSGYGDINSPWSQGQLRTHMANLRGGEQNLVDQYAKAAASGGVTSGRGGFGVTGGASPEAQLQQNAMRTLGNMYGQNYGQSMGYLKSSADSMDAQAAAMANLYGNIYRTNADTGLGYSRLGLEGTQGDAAAQEAWNNRLFGAYQRDTGNTNRLREGEADNLYKRKMQQQGLTDAQFAADQKAGNLQQLKDAYARLNRPDRGGMGEGDLGYLDYLRTITGGATPWNRTEAVQRRA